jgi:threonine dehydrogenase-like Zn-dependent dehydrogenase
VKAVVFRDIGAVAVEDVPDPDLEAPDDAVVRVTTTAICGSDLHFYKGKAPIDPGDVIGHEAVGVVEAVGPQVTRFTPGDRVVVAFNIVCGRCWFCRRGQTSLCDEFRSLGAGPFGGSLAGAQAERLRVPHADTNLLRIPGGMDDERALFVGDILTTGVYAAGISGIRAGDTVAVVGAGPVGWFAMKAAMAAGPAGVLALDMRAPRLEVAERLGAIPVNVRERNPQMAVESHTEGRGADVVIEAVGSTECFETSVAIVRRGGTVTVAGVYVSETVEVQLGVYWSRGITLRFGGVCPVHAWWERAMDAVASGAIDPLPIISHRMALAEAPEAYGLFERREATKIVLKP